MVSGPSLTVEKRAICTFLKEFCVTAPYLDLLGFVQCLSVLTLSDAFKVVVVFNVDHVWIIAGVTDWVVLDLLEDFVVVVSANLTWPQLLLPDLVQLPVEVVEGDDHAGDVVTGPSHGVCL